MEVRKGQEVRAFDVLVLGPFLVWASARARLTRGERLLLLLAGAGTIAYNARNYARTAALVGPSALAGLSLVRSDELDGAAIQHHFNLGRARGG